MLKEGYIQTGPFTTHYWEAGEGHPVILLHGGGAGADGYGNFRGVMELFAKRGYRAIAYDAFGFGKSDKPDPKVYEYSHDNRAKQLFDFIDALEIKEPVTLIGNSMGGAVSLTAVLMQPEKIQRMILMGTSGGRIAKKGEPPAPRGTARLNVFRDFETTRECMVDIAKNLTHDGFELDEQLIDYRLEISKLPGALEAFRATYEWIVQSTPILNEENVKTIKQNILLVHGKNDKIVPVQHAIDLFSALENAWLYCISHCGHWAMIEYPEEFTNICVEFIEKH